MEIEVKEKLNKHLLDAEYALFETRAIAGVDDDIARQIGSAIDSIHGIVESIRKN